MKKLSSAGKELLSLSSGQIHKITFLFKKNHGYWVINYTHVAFRTPE